MPQTPQRNSPCPCGSGKKYKKCCMVNPSGGTSKIPYSPLPLSSPSPFFRHPSAAPGSDTPEEPFCTSENNTTPEIHPISDSLSTIRLMNMDNAAEVIEKLEMGDLQALNKLIVDRINYLIMSNKHKALSRFTPGNRVRFTSKSGERKTGTVIRVNQKTVSVAVDGDRGWWKVSPEILHHI